MKIIYPDHVPFEQTNSIEKSMRDYYPHVIHNEPPPITMKLEMPILEKQIAEKGMHPNEKSTRKNASRKSKKIHNKSDKSAMA